MTTQFRDAMAERLTALLMKAPAEQRDDLMRAVRLSIDRWLADSPSTEDAETFSRELMDDPIYGRTIDQANPPMSYLTSTSNPVELVLYLTPSDGHLD